MPNDDYIKRSDALKATCENCTEQYVCNGKCDDTDRLKEIPAADVEPVRHGRWVASLTGWNSCSECGSEPNENEKTLYCPNCGAKMDKEEDV